MKTAIITSACAGMLLAGTALAGVHGTHWGYAGHEAPEFWGDLSHDYAVCKTGRNQAPIDIANLTESELSPIVFQYNSVPLSIVNNGLHQTKNADVQRLIQVGDLVIGTVHRHEKLDQVIGADRKEVHFLGERIGHQRRRRRFDHHADRHVRAEGDAFFLEVLHDVEDDGLGLSQFEQVSD